MEENWRCRIFDLIDTYTKGEAILGFAKKKVSWFFLGLGYSKFMFTLLLFC